MDTNTWLVILTALIALLAYLTLRVYRRIAWLTGAMESHSTLMLRFEALRAVNSKGEPLKVIWWDPDIPPPGPPPQHGQDASINEIRVYLPPHLRRGRKAWWAKAWHFVVGD